MLTFPLEILVLLEQNRQAKESKLVYDELLRAIREARTELVNLRNRANREPVRE